MLYFIAVWVVLLLSCAAIGTGVLHRFGTTDLRRSDRWIVSLWLGVLALAITLLTVSLFMPLSPFIGAIVVLSLVLLSLRSCRTRDELKRYQSYISQSLLLRFFGIAIAVAAFLSQPVVWVDTGFYHYGLIQWLSQFGTVPGLALLYSPLGFTSSWFAIAAPFNPSVLDARVSPVINGFAVLIVILQVWVCLSQIYKHKGTKSDWFIVVTTVFLVPLILLSKTLQAILVSPSPDLAIVFLIIIVAWLLLILANQNSNASLIPLVISTGAMTIKLTALPLVAVCSLFLISRGLNFRRLFFGIAIVGVILAPFLVSGVITSGCPLYPSSSICFDLPWSPSSNALQHIANNTHRWASWYGTQPTTLGEWLALIWTWLMGERRNQVVVGLGLMSVFGVVYLAKQAKQFYDQGQLWAIAVALSGIVFLMLTSPLLRFQLAYILIIPGLFVSQLCASRDSRLIGLTATKPLIRFSIAILSVIVVIHTPLFASVLLPPRLPTVEVIQKQINNLTYFYPRNANQRMCWAAPLPCTSIRLKNIALRDPNQGIAGGFIRLLQ